MAYTIQAGDIIKLSVICMDGDQAGINTQWRQCVQVGGSGITDQAMVDEYENGVDAYYKPLLNNNASFEGCILQVLHNIQWMAPVIQTAHAGAGTGGATALPRQVSGFLRLRSALGGRRARGRLYIPFPATAHDQGNGIPTGAYVTALASLAADELLNYTQFGSTPNYIIAPLVIYHRAGKTPIPAPTPVNQIDAVAKWATQRRRGSFGRTNSNPLS